MMKRNRIVFAGNALEKRMLSLVWDSIREGEWLARKAKSHHPSLSLSCIMTLCFDFSSARDQHHLEFHSDVGIFSEAAVLWWSSRVLPVKVLRRTKLPSASSLYDSSSFSCCSSSSSETCFGHVLFRFHPYFCRQQELRFCVILSSSST